MRIRSFRLINVRCFQDTGDVVLGVGCNIFVGGNNAGKTTLLRAVTSWQVNPFSLVADGRPGEQVVINELVLDDVASEDFVRRKPVESGTMRLVRFHRGERAYSDGIPTHQAPEDAVYFEQQWPKNLVIPFFAKRKASGYDENVNSSSQGVVNGTFSNLYARIDRVVSPGTKAHEFYKNAVLAILGVFISTQSSPNGKKAGYFYDEDTFVPLDQMGDGVSEIVALIVDLSLAVNKVFVIEEPETNLHPRGLKALLALIRESSQRNQFIIATHSNIVVRELGSEEETRVFRVYRDGETADSPSTVSVIERSPQARLELLRELGYEFGDFDLHDGWLFLEESSAESIIREILIPSFVPELRGRLRTFSANGVTNLEASVFEFQRLVTFIHLSPVYQSRIWVRADGDEPGHKIIDNIKEKFPYLSSRAEVFSRSQFEEFYPEIFDARVKHVLSIKDKSDRRSAKASLLREVLDWTRENQVDAMAAWHESAAEQIALLENILIDLKS